MIFISGNTPSSKNSKVWTGKFLVSSPQTQRYIKATKEQWEKNKGPFLIQIKEKQKPYKIGLYFVRDSKRRFDYVNIAQIIFDLMIKYGWIEDDNAYEITPVFLGFSIDKSNPGVYVKILDDNLLDEYVI